LYWYLLVVVSRHDFSSKAKEPGMNIPGQCCSFKMMDREMLRKSEKKYLIGVILLQSKLTLVAFTVKATHVPASTTFSQK